MDRKMRDLLRSHLHELVPDDELDDTVELLRVFINGVVLSSAEGPTQWNPARVRRLLDQVLRRLALTGLPSRREKVRA
ncbi:TetR family transcriptional regulator C-terminal domain-containing protein [Paractinoplanes durhamensis]|uniref:BetI-type transcriptional repressor C-terminal domain-containing protein n=1 Tax=Paractinoplanes durhamensis TaxID=113563 RepID=A0ABQ3ZD10_9ACTN|nr:TetR family transcriptional regulator C-terminal domain-containing protein [Actinoplanes durhamensis]GIE07748.1 hypothetical protein Adu01nite_90980 [Actinoplanes durhamensis]